MKISSILRRFSIVKLTEFMPQHLQKLMTKLQGFRETSSCSSDGSVGECCMMPSTSSISVKRGWKPLPKSMRIPCWSLVWSFLTSLCSVMNIGAFSMIWHLPTRQTKVWLRGIFQTSLLRVILGLLAHQQLWPLPNGLQEWAVIEGMICKKRHPNIEILKCSLMKAVADFPKRTLHNSIDGWPKRLSDCVKTKSSHFEKW